MRPYQSIFAFLLYFCLVNLHAQSTYLLLKRPAYHLLDRIKIKSANIDTAYIFTPQTLHPI